MTATESEVRDVGTLVDSLSQALLSGAGSAQYRSVPRKYCRYQSGPKTGNNATTTECKGVRKVPSLPYFP